MFASLLFAHIYEGRMVFSSVTVDTGSLNFIKAEFSIQVDKQLCC
jgi:hypothetical protein